MINGSVINGVVLNGAGSSGSIPIIEDVAETAVVTNPEPLLADYLLVTDSAVVTGDYVPPLIRGLVVRDTAAIAATATVDRAARLTVRDGFVATDHTYGARHVIQLVADSAVVTDSADYAAPGLTVRDSAIITSAPTVAVTKRLDVRDTFKGFAEPAASGSLAVRDTLVGTGTATPFVIQRLDVRDGAVIVSITDEGAAGSRTVDVRETASVFGYVSARLTARNIQREIGYLSDRLVGTDGLLGDDGFAADTVWTASVATWGMSRHTGGGITQRGGRYAVSPDGLYEVGEGYSPASFDTGYLMLGSKALKHIPTVYWQGERDGAFTLTVTADRRGARTINSYPPLGRAQDKSRSIRVEIGRGYRSTYYKFQVNTTDRADIFGGEAAVVATERRI